MINWKNLEAAEQLDDILAISNTIPCIIYKHSTRCSLSSLAKHRLEINWDFDDNELEPYFLDVIRNQDVSNLVAKRFSVYHESPQILLIRNGECTYETSHLNITLEDLRSSLHLS